MNEISKLGFLRFVEKSDTGLTLRRDESSQNNRRKKENDHEAQNAPETEDAQDVSVMGLYAFLAALLASRLAPENAPPEAQTPAQNINNARSNAAKAYGRTQNFTEKRNVNIEIDEEQSSAANPNITLADDFSEEDIKKLKNLKTALLDLNRKGVETLTLNGSLPLLDAIEEAIKE